MIKPLLIYLFYSFKINLHSFTRKTKGKYFLGYSSVENNLDSHGEDFMTKQIFIKQLFQTVNSTLKTFLWQATKNVINSSLP